MANTVAIEFAGDARKLQQAGKNAEQANLGVADSASRASDDMMEAGRGAQTYTDRVGALGAGVSGMTDAFDAAGAAVQGLADFQSAGVERAQRLARASNDVRQAMEDQQQAVRDASQAMIDSDQAVVDMEQAQLDAAAAQRDYNEAVKEHGKDSIEARQAQIDLKQAGVDLRQAQEDSNQAIRDGAQASIDAEAATLDLAEAQREANPPDLQKWADQVSMITPILSGLMGVVGLVTAAQWAWNAAQWASPTTWIIAAVIALVAVIVLIATKTDWFQRAWRNSWKWIKDAAKNTWDWLKQVPGWVGGAFRKIADFITLPFRAAFNAVARLWNNTLGSLSFTIPGWVPGIGGNGFSMPRVPTFHQGGRVPGAPGTEVLAMLQAGETVTSTAGSVAGGGEQWIRVDLGELGEALLAPIAKAVGRRGGSVTALGVRVTAGRVV
jgi:hypothetical protein